MILTAIVTGCRGTSNDSRGRVPPPPDALPPAANCAIRLIDRATGAGIRFHLGHDGRTPLTILDTAGCGCAFLDYDGDGWLDILLVGQPRCALYHNNHNGTFTDVTTKSGLTATGAFMGVAVGDYDNDGRPDLLLTGYGRNVLYHNVGGRFQDVTTSSGLASRGPWDWATSAAFVDLDGDGRLDVLLGHYVRFTPNSLQFCKYNGVQAACPPFYYDAEKLTVYRGDGKGHFEDVTAAWGFTYGHGRNLGLAAQDFDGSGAESVYVANDALPGDLWVRSGRGFTNIGLSSGTGYDRTGNVQAGMGVDWGDYDGDTRSDLVVTTFQDQPKALYHNDGGRAFHFSSEPAGIAVATTNRLAFGVAFADFDDDGWPDLLMLNGHVQDTINQFRPPATYAQTMQLFHNLGGGKFQDLSHEAGADFARPIVGRGLAIGDYDNDGRPDVLAVDLEGRPLLLHNESQTGHWMGVHLVGRRCNRDAIGARVLLKAGGRCQVREVQTGRSYLSASDPRLLFGLGRATQVDSMLIRWPDGHVQTVRCPGIDRYLNVAEA